MKNKSIFKTLNFYSFMMIILFLVVGLMVFNKSKYISDYENIKSYTKLIISNLSLNFDSKIKEYVNLSLNEGVGLGPIINFSMDTDIQDTFLEDGFMEYEKVQNESILNVYYLKNNIFYYFEFDLNYILKEIIFSMDLSENYAFVDDYGEFLSGDMSFYNNVKKDKLTFSELSLDEYKNGYIVYNTFENLGINFLFYKKAGLYLFIKRYFLLFILFIFISFIITTFFNYIISSGIKNMFNEKIKDMNKSFDKNRKYDLIKTYDELDIPLENFFNEKKKSFYALKEKILTNDEFYYLYEVSIQHNSLLIEIISFIQEFFDEDFKREDIDLKLNDIEKSKKYKEIDEEFFNIIKNDVGLIYKKVENFKFKIKDLENKKEIDIYESLDYRKNIFDRISNILKLFFNQKYDDEIIFNVTSGIILFIKYYDNININVKKEYVFERRIENMKTLDIFICMNYIYNEYFVEGGEKEKIKNMNEIYQIAFLISIIEISFEKSDFSDFKDIKKSIKEFLSDEMSHMFELLYREIEDFYIHL